MDPQWILASDTRACQVFLSTAACTQSTAGGTQVFFDIFTQAVPWMSQELFLPTSKFWTYPKPMTH